MHPDEEEEGATRRSTEALPLAKTDLKIEGAHHGADGGAVEDNRAECFTIDNVTSQKATKETLDVVNGLSGTPKVGDIHAAQIDTIDQDGDGVFSLAEVPRRLLLNMLEIFVKRIGSVLCANLFAVPMHMHSTYIGLLCGITSAAQLAR